MQLQGLSNSISFKDFLIKDKRNKVTLCVVLALIIIQFSIFKYFYPYANYIHGDSFNYLRAADENATINTYLIGYSKFLRLFSVFTHSDTILVTFQFIFLYASSLCLIFSLFYLYKPGKVVQLILLSFIVFNPLFLHLANLVSSDCMFLALSLIWFNQLLWILHSPTFGLLIWHAAVLFIAFTFRYNALIYPFVSVTVFLIAKIPLKQRLMGIATITLFCGSFVVFTSYQYKKLTGNWQYSPFSGWQWANNAMYTYRYVDSADREPVPQRFRELDNRIREYFDSTRDTKRHIQETLQASTIYMWSFGSPLYVYRESLFQSDSTALEFKKWASMGPLFTDYGIYIIKKYPQTFARYFVWPNANKYYAPPIEFLEVYNGGRDSVTSQTKEWFGYKSEKVSTRMKINQTFLLSFYPILSGIINVVMLFGLLSFILLNGYKREPYFRIGIFTAGTIWFLNAAFTILASSAALRFQAFPITLTTLFSVLLVDWLWTMANIKSGADTANRNNNSLSTDYTTASINS